jgi:2-phosphosulfolactate phosphatase
MSERKLHVILRKEDIDPERLADKIVIVIDTLFATTTIVHALASGARSVTPALNGAEARLIAGRADGSEAAVLAGELHGETLPGFTHPTPQALVACGLRGRRVVYSTTNGTIALRRAQGALAVYAACLRNARATMDEALARHPGRTVILLCAGSAGAFNIEDFFTAGTLGSHFRTLAGDGHLTDSAQAAIQCSRGDVIATLLESRIGRRYADRWRHEIEFAGQVDADDTVARLEGGSVVPAARRR